MLNIPKAEEKRKSNNERELRLDDECRKDIENYFKLMDEIGSLSTLVRFNIRPMVKKELEDMGYVVKRYDDRDNTDSWEISWYEEKEKEIDTRKFY